MTRTKCSLTRRDFFKVSALGLGALAAGRVDFAHPLPPSADVSGPIRHPTPESVATTCAQCMNQCGLVARLENGIVVKLDGNPDHPSNQGRMCAKGQAGIQKLYDPQRVLHPLRRTGKRGPEAEVVIVT